MDPFSERKSWYLRKQTFLQISLWGVESLQIITSKNLMNPYYKTSQILNSTSAYVKTYSQSVRDLWRWESLKMVLAGNKATLIFSVDHSSLPLQKEFLIINIIIIIISDSLSSPSSSSKYFRKKNHKHHHHLYYWFLTFFMKLQ